MLMRFFAVAKTGPEVDDPRLAPSSVTPSMLQSPFKRLASGGCKFGVFCGRDLLSWVEGEEMRDVAVAGLWLIKVFEPLLKLAVLADRG